MDEIDRKQLYNTAWKHWGAEAQIDMLIEEMAELTQALLKARRNGVIFSYSTSEEIAEVLICLEQIEEEMKVLPYNVLDIGESTGCAYSSNIFDGQVLIIKEQKLKRLKERLMESMTKKHEGLGEQVMLGSGSRWENLL